MSGYPRTYPWRHTCERCGKQGYQSRKAARRAARRFHPGERMSTYQCGDCWHNGHAPDALRHGAISRKELAS